MENYLSSGRRVDGAYRPDYPKPEGEKQALRAVIRSTGADVIALQEMGDRAHLAELQRDLLREGVVYQHAEWLAGNDPDRHVAVLSRLPFAQVGHHDRVPVRYLNEPGFVRRGVLEVAFALGGGEVTLFVVHLKSRYTERRDDPDAAAERAAEAVAVRDLVLERFPDPAAAQFMIVGDFNDSRENRPLRAMTMRGRTTIARILSAEDDRGDAWTLRYRGNETYSRFDFILVSPGLEAFARSLESRVVDAPRVRDASDHRPVVVTMRWD